MQTIEDVLSTLAPPPYSVDVSIVLQSVRVRHDHKLGQETLDLAIKDAGFDIEPPTPRDSLAADERKVFSKTAASLFPAKQSKHIAQCSLCQSSEAQGHDTPHPSASENLPEVPERTAEDQGPAALSLSIGGMTCVACSNTLTQLLSEVEGVSDVVVDLVGHSARVVVESQKLTPIVTETVEDAGYDAEVVKAEPLVKAPTQETTTRTIQLKVDGMHCQWGFPAVALNHLINLPPRHCPSKVADALECLRPKVTVIKPITTHTDQIVKISYTPGTSVFTIRTIISAIASANSPPFDVSVYHPPTLEERACRTRLLERWNLLYRLAFSFIVAIPTFIVGIVYMTLVSRQEPIRMYLMTPVWAGSVSRAEWALFIMSTPVMCYSAGAFHRRSIKEIRTLWGKASKMPVWKRFVRFGSMNLLVNIQRGVACDTFG